MKKRFWIVLATAATTGVFVAALALVLSLTTPEHFPLPVALWAVVFVGWTSGMVCLVLLAIKRSERVVLRNLNRARDTVHKELAAKNNHDVIQEVRDARSKQSRHEYRQELLLDRIDAGTSTLLADIDAMHSPAVIPQAPRIQWHGTASDPDAPRVLFITSNGSGMGHLSRCLTVAAEAERSGLRTAILTLSTAYAKVRESGYPVMYHPSSAASPWTLPVWNRSFARYLHRLFESDRPDLVVFDGTAVYRGVTQTCRRFEVPLTWLRRGMWKPEVTRVQYDRPFDVADYVVVPGEVGAKTSQEQNDVEYVLPISQARQLDILEPSEAKNALGLDPTRHYALVQVGTAQFDSRPIAPTAVALIKKISPDLTPVVLVSPIAGDHPDVDGAVVIHGRYPLAPYLRAFDVAVTSAGYNSVHENLAVTLPAVYVPKTTAVTDDQAARADLVTAKGCGLTASDESELATALRDLLSEGRADALRENIRALDHVDGSVETVSIIVDALRETALADLHPRP